MAFPQFLPSMEMVFDTAAKDQKRLLEYCQAAERDICINLSNVTNCDSAGLALLIEARRLSRQTKKNFSIVGITPAIQALAEFCGVKSILLNNEQLESV